MPGTALAESVGKGHARKEHCDRRKDDEAATGKATPFKFVASGHD